MPLGLLNFTHLQGQSRKPQLKYTLFQHQLMDGFLHLIGCQIKAKGNAQETDEENTDLVHVFKAELMQYCQGVSQQCLRL